MKTKTTIGIRYCIGFIIAIGFIISNTKAKAQGFTGRDFWFAYMENVASDNSVNPPEVLQYDVSIISAVATSGTISIPLKGWSQNFTVAPNTVTFITLPFSLADNTGKSDVALNTGVHVVANNDVLVYVGNDRIYSSDAATAIPTDALGTSYHVVGYGDAAQGKSEFNIIATQPNTTVTINLKTRSTNHAGMNSNYNVTLNQGQVYQIQSFNGAGVPSGAFFDLTGATINSDKPVAVYSGNICAIPGNCLYCDNLFEQIRPTTSWGKNYLAAFTKKVSVTPDLVRVYASQNGTSYTLGGIGYTLNAREFRDHDLLNGLSVVSNNPVYVGQFLRGSQCSTPPAPIDPLFLDVLPTEQFAANYLFATSPFTRFTGGHLATIIIETAQTGTLKLNGAAIAPSFTAISGTTYSYGYITLAPNKVYNLLSTSNSAFGVSVYGYGSDESYGYVAGGNMLDLVTPISLIKFNTSILSNSTRLDWVVASEENCDSYIVEHSKDGLIYSAIGTVSGAGNTSTTTNYSFVDATPVKGLNYYRLKQRDIDGKINIMGVRVVEFKSNQVLSLLNVGANPILNNKLNISIASGNVTPINYQIIDVTGRIVLNGKWDVITEGENNLTIDLNIEKGIYYLIAQKEDSDEMIKWKFIKE